MLVERFTVNTTISQISNYALQYFESLKVVKDGKVLGYRHSKSTTQPILYSTVAVVLTKHLLGEPLESVKDEIELILAHQSEDGLFKDSVIQCREAEQEDWWGWRHLSLHCLMALALYDKIAPIEQSYLLNFCNERYLEKYLATRDWGERVAWTSNELQNLGVMLQYARDYQEMTVADGILLRIYEEIQKRQDKKTGLFGQSFQTPWEISLGVQSGYHFWLLMHYDNFPLQNVEKIIDNLLSSQNILGGYSINWNSSACEDIDSIDPLYRLSRLTNYRNDEIQKSLKRALPQILVNLNIDGGWVFKRNEELKVVHSEMYSGVNESNIFFTWFRILGLAYCLLGMKEVPKGYTYNWQFKRAPGQQFL